MYAVAKLNERLSIIRLHENMTYEVVYTPPNFVSKKMRDRHGLDWLADMFDLKKRRDIKSIVQFESSITHPGEDI